MNKIIQRVLAVLVYVLIFGFIYIKIANQLDFTAILSRSDMIYRALFRTLVLSLLALISSSILGFIMFLMIQSKSYFLRDIAKIFREIIMGTPLLVLVFVIVYIIGTSINIGDKMTSGFIAVTLYMSPYMANVFEGAYKTIDNSQHTVMNLYHLNSFQRYFYIILPQMIRPMMPGLINNLSGIVKGTSILSTIAVAEIFYTVSIISNQTYRYVEGYFILWLSYLVITLPLSALAQKLAKKEEG